VPVLRVDIDHDGREDSRREQLLALFALRRDLESGPPRGADGETVAAVIGYPTRSETLRERTIRELHELIDALDRRVPQVQRVGEVAIARAATALRIAALKRIDELEREKTDGAAQADARASRRGD
jgi:hypothetical protein